jgi:hypothetical protein
MSGRILGRATAATASFIAFQTRVLGAVEVGGRPFATPKARGWRRTSWLPRCRIRFVSAVGQPFVEGGSCHTETSTYTSRRATDDVRRSAR